MFEIEEIWVVVFELEGDTSRAEGDKSPGADGFTEFFKRNWEWVKNDVMICF